MLRKKERNNFFGVKLLEKQTGSYDNVVKQLKTLSYLFRLIHESVVKSLPSLQCLKVLANFPLCRSAREAAHELNYPQSVSFLPAVILNCSQFTPCVEQSIIVCLLETRTHQLTCFMKKVTNSYFKLFEKIPLFVGIFIFYIHLLHLHPVHN